MNKLLFMQLSKINVIGWEKNFEILLYNFNGTLKLKIKKCGIILYPYVFLIMNLIIIFLKRNEYRKI